MDASDCGAIPLGGLRATKRMVGEGCSRGAQRTKRGAQERLKVSLVSGAWELDSQIANAYGPAVGRGDERQRGLADGYTEASSTIEARGARLLDALLSSCGA